MAINIRGYANEELNELIKTQEELEKCIKEYDYQIKTNTTKWNIEDAKTHRLHLRKAFKNDILRYLNQDFNVGLGFGYTQTAGTFIGIKETGLCFFFTVKNEELDLNCCFYTSVNYFVKNFLIRAE